MPAEPQHLVLYRDPRFYASFPAVAALPSGEVLVLFRRARDQRWFARALGAEEEAGLMEVDHVDARSQHVLLRLGPDLAPLAEPLVLPPDGEAADQDANMLALQDGSVLVTGFCWYPVAARYAGLLRRTGSGLVGSAEDTGTLFLFWGGYARRSVDGGRSWTPHAFLPPVPGTVDAVRGVRPHLGGAIRGRAVEMPDGRVLQASYAYGPSGRRGSHLFASDDGGASWRHAGTIAFDPAGAACLVEPALLRTRTGRLVAFHRTVGMEDRLVTAVSEDGGATWSPPRVHAMRGHPHDPLPLGDGRVLLAYGWRHPPYGIRARLYDPDREQPEEVPEIVVRADAAGPDVGYPWAVELGEGRVLAVYYFTDAGGIRHVAGSVLELG